MLNVSKCHYVGVVKYLIQAQGNKKYRFVHMTLCVTFFLISNKNQKTILFIFCKTDYNYLRVPTMVYAHIEDCITTLWNQCCCMAQNATEWQPTASKRSMPSTADASEKTAASSGLRRSKMKTRTGWPSAPLLCQLCRWRSLWWWSLGSLFSRKSHLFWTFVPVINNTGLRIGEVCVFTHISW